MSQKQDLICALSRLLHHPSTKSIEILPGGLEDWQSVDLPSDLIRPHKGFPFLLAEGNLGVPQTVLYGLYKTAVTMQLRSKDPDQANAISSVLLLLNPAHQTALNVRKRLIVQGGLPAVDELTFLELILRGLRECAKQSILWDHRRWCLTLIHGSLSGVPVPSTFTCITPQETAILPRMNPSSIQQEFQLIAHACESYPRNYHAWTHWNTISNICYLSFLSSDDTQDSQSFLRVLCEETALLQSWVERHVSDYSAIHQLCRVQSIIERLPISNIQDSSIIGTITVNPIAHALSLVKSYPSHESLWMYLRICLGNIPAGARNEALNQVKQLSTGTQFYNQMYRWLQLRI